MDDRLYNAFDAVQADEALKQRTAAAVTARIDSRRRSLPLRRWAAAAACALVVLGGFGGYRVYATPTAKVYIDLPQAVELDVNRFGRVVTAKGTDADVCHRTYEDALTAIFGATDADGVAVTVDGDPNQCDDISDAVTRCSGGRAYCHGQENGSGGGHHGGGQQHRHGWED